MFNHPLDGKQKEFSFTHLEDTWIISTAAFICETWVFRDLGFSVQASKR